MHLNKTTLALFVAALFLFSFMPLMISAGLAGTNNESSSAEIHAELERHLYYYKARVVAVYDGDTITTDIDLGFHTWIHGEKLRLARINAPEVRGKEKVAGKVSRDWLREQILDKEVIIHTKKKKRGGEKTGKYGRYIVEVYLDGVNLNDALVAEGLAVYKEY